MPLRCPAVARLLGALGAVALYPSEAAAQDHDVPRPRPPALRYLYEGEYYYPRQRERQIHTLFVNALVGVELVESIHLSVHGGPTTTFASGYILQWNARFEDVRYDTTVAGIGGILMLRCDPLRVGRFGLGVDAGGGIILYSAQFPPGGDWYNLFWKIGLTASVTLTDRMALYAGVRGMHVSNGQGIGQHNPAYEGYGLAVGVEMRW